MGAPTPVRINNNFSYHTPLVVRIGFIAGGMSMGRKIPIFYNALLLTGVNLLLRLVSTSFQVFISGRIGAAGVGLLQLVLSVASMTMTAGVAGIRTASMYLTAEELGRGRPGNVTWVLSCCFLYSLLFSGAVGLAVYILAPWIAGIWIGNLQVVGAVRLFAAFLPVSCFVGIMVGYFTAANRIATLAAVEVIEQLCAMMITAFLLVLWAGEDMGRACQSVVAGSCAGGLLTLSCLVVLRLREHAVTGPRIPVAKRLLETALPLAAADDLKVGINTVENLMVPKRLSLYTDSALSQFGIVCGMVFPLMMFPAAILFGLADLLIPEMARCNAGGSRHRIRYLARRTLRITCIFGLACSGVIFLCAPALCRRLYSNEDAATYLRWYALLIPMLYCDLVIDAMNKGLGKQRICVTYNIITAVMDVAGLYILLPVWGMKGYFVSFFISHFVNALLSVRLLMKTAGIRIRIWVPVAALGCMAGALYGAGFVDHSVICAATYLVLLVTGLVLLGVLRREDLRWLLGLVNFQKTEKNRISLKKVFDK